MHDLEVIKSMNGEKPVKKTLIPLKCSKCKKTWNSCFGDILNLNSELICPNCGVKISNMKRVNILAQPLVKLISEEALDLEEIQDE
jgi:DNA-directed RNA polymerase subunit RPC12/RpoP